MQYIKCQPTPEALVQMLLAILNNSRDPKDRAFAIKELNKAMRIAYAYWYPDDPEYRIKGINPKASFLDKAFDTLTKEIGK